MAVPARPARARCDRGSVTAETAIALPAVMVVLATVMATGQALVAQVRCVDAARAAARLAARGEPETVSVTQARRLGPAGSDVGIGPGTGGDVVVRVSALVHLPLGLTVPVQATAEAAVEQP